MLKRIGLFLLVNFLIMAVLSVSLMILTPILASFGIDLTGRHTFGIVSAALFGFGGAFASLFMAKWMAKRFMGVQVFDQTVNDNRLRWIHQIVAKQAKEANIKMPELGLFQDPNPNAFATGSSRNNSMVAVSAGLLSHMNDDEVEAVLGHEIAHIANGDMVTMALIQGLVNTFVIILSRVIGTFIDRVVFRTEEGIGMGYFIGYFMASIILTFLASFITMWFSRKREFKADEGGAYLAGKEKMIAALEKLKTLHPEPLPDEMAAFGIVGGSKIMALLSSHPPIEDRIAALRNTGYQPAIV